MPGSAAAVDLDFSATEGSVTGKLLPTGSLKDVLQVPELGALEVSLVDAGHTHIYNIYIS